MAAHTEQLLVCQKSNKTSRPLFVLALRDLHGTAALPLDALGPGEQSLHEGLLGAEGDVNIAVAHAGALRDVMHSLDSVNRGVSIHSRCKLHIAVHGLPGRTLHDDVDWEALSQPGVTSEELDHLLTCDSVWDLHQSDICQRQDASKPRENMRDTHVLDEHNSVVRTDAGLRIAAKGAFSGHQDLVQQTGVVLLHSLLVLVPEVGRLREVIHLE